MRPSRAEILALLAAELAAMGIDLPEPLPESLSFREDLDLESLSVIEFVARMERAFRVQVADEDWQRLGTLGAVADFIEERLAT